MTDIFNRMKERENAYQFRITISYLEVYNETIRDLLVEKSRPLPLREDPRRGTTVAQLTTYNPESASEVFDLLERGNARRSQSPTDANSESSRSHAVLQIFVEAREKLGDVQGRILKGKLSLVDLAGSERAASSRNAGMLQFEGANINRSLLALGNCINALCKKQKPGHIPYRDSKLTRLLQDSLGGNCKTVMIANISPSGRSYEDTHNTLKYANNAKRIRVKQTQNQHKVGYHVGLYKEKLAEFQAEIARLKEQLGKSGGSGPSTTSLVDKQRVGAVRTAITARFANYEQIQSEMWSLRRRWAECDAARKYARRRVLQWEQKKKAFHLTEIPEVVSAWRAQIAEAEEGAREAMQRAEDLRRTERALKRDMDKTFTSDLDRIPPGPYHE
eukprot:258064_1